MLKFLWIWQKCESPYWMDPSLFLQLESLMCGWIGWCGLVFLKVESNPNPNSIQIPYKLNLIQEYHTNHVQICLCIGGTAGTCPPTGLNSFVFTDVSAKKFPCWKLAPPNRLVPPKRKSWIYHCCD